MSATSVSYEKPAGMIVDEQIIGVYTETDYKYFSDYTTSNYTIQPD